MEMHGAKAREKIDGGYLGAEGLTMSLNEGVVLPDCVGGASSMMLFRMK